MTAEDGAGGITVFCAKPAGLSGLETLMDEGAPISSVITVSGGAEAELKSLAGKLKVPVFSGINLNDPDEHKNLISSKPSAVMSISYPNRIPAILLDQYSGGAFNFHPARLPEYRGCLPTVWPILNDDSEADYTMHIMEEGFDTGPLIDRETLSIKVGENGWSLYQRLVETLPGLIRRNLDDILSGRCRRHPQDEKKARYYPNCLPHNGIVDWRWTGEEIDRFVRALYHPIFSGAKAQVNGAEIEILQVGDIERDPVSQLPGSVVTGPDGVIISCGDGRISLKTIRYEGLPLILGGEVKIPSIFQ
jgi:methionyl-tRNA formyltransferase